MASSMTDASDVAAFWKDAIKAYEQESEHKIDQDALAHIQSTDDLLRYIESRGQDFESFRSRHAAVWSALKRVLEPTVTVGNIVSSVLASGQISSPGAIVLTSVLHLIQSCREVTNAYDWIRQVFGELLEFAERLQNYLVNPNDALRRKIVAILAFTLRIIGRSETLIKRKRFREYLRVTFIGKDDRTKHFVEELNEVLANEQRLVLSLTYGKTQELSTLARDQLSVTSEMRDTVIDTCNEVHDLHESIESKRAEERALANLKDVLLTPVVADTDDWCSLLQRSLLRGSGAWLEKEDLFDYWMQHQAPVLWIFGGPGAGKSMLSAWLITMLHARVERSTDLSSTTSVGYFFIKENKEGLRNLNSMFKTFAWQIQQHDPLFRNHAALVCNLSRNTARAEDTWQNIFLDFYQSAQKQVDDHRTILVIDGLDEADYDTRLRLLKLMRKYVARVRSGHPHRIQFAVFGRTTLRSDLQHVHFDREERIIEVLPAKNSDDLRNYIDHRLKALSVISTMRTSRGKGGDERAKKFARSIRRQVLSSADGVFLWAQLLLDQMEGKDEAQIRRLIEKPPKNLDDMIHSVLERLSQDPDLDSTDTKTILTWIAFAKRPLRFGEIDVLLRLNTSASNWLLWGHMRGKFSSILRLRYPRGYDPENGIEDETIVEDDKEADLQTTSTAEADRSGVTPCTDSLEGEGDEQIDDEDDFDLGDDDEDDEYKYEPVNGPDAEKANDETDTTQLSAEINNNGEANGGSEADTEPDQIHDWYQKRTIVDFSHQRFRDLLVIESDSNTAVRKPLSIIADISTVDLEMTLQCLRMLRLGSKLDSVYLAKHYVSYPAFNVFKHLHDVDVDKISLSQTTQIVEDLYWLLHEEPGCRALLGGLGERKDGECDAFWSLWLGSKKTTSMLQRWFSQASNDLSLDRLCLEWMSKASISVKTLLEPLARCCATIWLTKKGYDDLAYTDKSEFHVCFLAGYRSMDEHGNLSAKFEGWTEGRNLRFTDMAADEIIEIAEWADLEKTTHWYTGVGWIVYESCDYEKAIELLDQAVELDPEAWVPMEAKARAIAEGGGNLQDAVDEMQRALDHIPESLSNVKSYLSSRVAIWKQDLGDYSGALEIAKFAWEENSASLPAIHAYVRALCIAKDWEVLGWMLAYLDDWDNGYNSTYLIKYLSTYRILTGLGQFAKAKNQPSFLLDAFNDAIKALTQETDEYMLIDKLFEVAYIRYAFYIQEEEPVRLYEEAFLRLRTADAAVQRWLSHDKVVHTNRLAQLYFDIAVRNHRDGNDSSEAQSKLKQLASAVTLTSDDAEVDTFDFYTPGYPSLLWGRWLREYELAATPVWRKCFRTRILEQMAGLDDDDPANDTTACVALAMSLFQAGDEKNAGAILAVVFTTLETYLRDKRETEESQQTQINDDDQNNKTAADVSEQGRANAGDLHSAALIHEQVQRPLAGIDEPCQTHESSTSELAVGQQVSADQTTSPRKSVSDESKDPVQVVSLPLHIDQWAWRYQCDGCQQDAEDAGDLYFCEICYDINFCGECLEKMKEGTLAERACNGAHKWYKAWPQQTEVVQGIIEEVLDGEVKLRPQWLEALRNEWLVE